MRVLGQLLFPHEFPPRVSYIVNAVETLVADDPVDDASFSLFLSGLETPRDSESQ
jgi:hypothetical protein